MPHTTNRPARKTKRSFTLSPEAVAFLEAMRERNHAESVSAVLEQILEGVRRNQQRKSLDRAVTDYYSSLPDSEVHEQAQWGEFALAQFRDQDES